MSKQFSDFNSTQLKILEAAEKEFVEKGYDGSRVDEIASRAKINKSQLYYHFGSKENILKELMKKHICEAGKIVENNFDISKIDSENSFEGFVDKLCNFFREKENIVRIIMIEMLKDKSTDNSIFEIFDPLYREVKSSVEKMGFKSDNNTFPVSYFFFDIMPIIIYIIFADKFSAFYKMPKNELETEFRNLYKKSELKYFEKLSAKKTTESKEND